MKQGRGGVGVETQHQGVTYQNSASKAELEQSTFFPHLPVCLQTGSTATELCIPMYNYLLISWLAHPAKKVSRDLKQIFLLCLSFRPEEKNDSSHHLLGTSTSSTFYRLAEVEV